MSDERPTSVKELAHEIARLEPRCGWRIVAALYLQYIFSVWEIAGGPERETQRALAGVTSGGADRRVALRFLGVELVHMHAIDVVARHGGSVDVFELIEEARGLVECVRAAAPPECPPAENHGVVSNETEDLPKR